MCFTLVTHAISDISLKSNISFWTFYNISPTSYIDMHLDIPELRGDNYKIWKERILLHLGYMDIDYAIRKSEPPKVKEESTHAEVTLFERYERSNRLNVMFIKTQIITGIKGSIDQYDKVQDLLKAIGEQFVTSDKALASTLIMKFETRDRYVEVLPSALYSEHSSSSIRAF